MKLIGEKNKKLQPSNEYFNAMAFRDDVFYIFVFLHKLF